MKYVVTKPIVYAAPTGGRTRKGGRERKLVRHNVGDIVELDDNLADTFYRRVEPYFEPKPRPARKPKPADAEPADTRSFAEKQGLGKEDSGGSGL